MDFADLTRARKENVETGQQSVPPKQRIEIRCCDEVGSAIPWSCMILLSAEDLGLQARAALIHEIYHPLGFAHPDGETEVSKGSELNSGGRGLYAGSTPIDLAKLVFIYD
ncbi:MAG: hypothetical protein OXC69_08645 [Candidatus Tectomicrobia bacterium]|nr:hypothetical protein [Candidatus Tectomicrobia bacterium]